MPSLVSGKDDMLSLKQDFARKDYGLQERCAEQAEQRFVKNFDHAMYNYQNHFNRKLNKCFLWVWSRDGGQSQYLLDVNENEPLGKMSVYDGTGFRCIMQGQTCSSESDWATLIKPYIEGRG